MRPGKRPTPRFKLDLHAPWKKLGEEPPGPIQTVDHPEERESRKRPRRA